jgi:hypothetical protein
MGYVHNVMDCVGREHQFSSIHPMTAAHSMTITA